LAPDRFGDKNPSVRILRQKEFPMKPSFLNLALFASISLANLTSPCVFAWDADSSSSTYGRSEVKVGAYEINQLHLRKIDATDPIDIFWDHYSHGGIELRIASNEEKYFFRYLGFYKGHSNNLERTNQMIADFLAQYELSLNEIKVSGFKVVVYGNGEGYFSFVPSQDEISQQQTRESKGNALIALEKRKIEAHAELVKTMGGEASSPLVNADSETELTKLPTGSKLKVDMDSDHAKEAKSLYQEKIQRIDAMIAELNAIQVQD